MNYKIIHDRDELQRFINWLPDLKDNEIFYGCLFARKKYCPDLVHSSDKTQLKRFTFKKINFIEKIKQLECEVGYYSLKDRPVPQEALVLYANPNPRCQKKATFASIKELVNLIERNATNYNLHQEVMSNIQRAKGTGHFVDFDFDLVSKDEISKIISQINCIINSEALTFVETRGGIHCLVQPSLVTTGNKWYPEMKKLGNIDQTGDQLLPVPGCIQGNFSPKFIYESTI